MAKYTPVAYDDKKFSKGINTKYYDNAITTYTEQANKQRNQEIAQADKSRVDQIRQAYIQNMQNKRALDTTLATSGIRGGATETANLNLANQYGTARATANTNYANAVTEINKTTDQNIADYTADMRSRAEEYRQNMAQSRWQAAREDRMNQQNALTDYYSNYYTNYYAGMKPSKLKSERTKVANLLARARKNGNTNQIIRLEQRMAGLNARLGAVRAANESIKTNKGKEIPLGKSKKKK